MLKLKRHIKLWHKFIANYTYLKVSPRRLVIKLFKGCWFLITWPFELLGDILIWPRPIKHIVDHPKILIIKVDQLGDLLFCTFLLPIIKEAYPASSIDYLIHPHGQAILDNNPAIRQVYYWQDLLLQNIPGRQKMKLGKRTRQFLATGYRNFKSWLALRHEHYDIVINARAFWPSCNWPWRGLGHYLIAFDISQASYVANYLADYNLRAEEWENYVNLLKPLSIKEDIIKQHEPRGQFVNFAPAPQKPIAPYWCLSPVSFDPERTWSPSRWLSFVQLFLENFPNDYLVITGLADQRYWLAAITQPLNSHNRVITVTNLSVPQLADLLKDSQGLISLDSFNVHLAIALKKPVFCLVNSWLFYVPGLSTNHLVDGRCMIPLLPEVMINDLLTTTPEQLNKQISNYYRVARV